MKFKILPLSILSIVAIASTALSSQAQSPKSQNNLSVQENTPTRKVAQRFSGSERFSDLDLTEEQKTKLQEVQENYRSQIDDILTSEQKDELKAEMESGKKPREVISNLELSSEQKEKMQELRKSQREEISSILTPEQKQKLKQRRQRL